MIASNSMGMWVAIIVAFIACQGIFHLIIWELNLR
jgi:hypothetical protein